MDTGPIVTLTEPNKNRTPLRLGLMVVMLACAIGATLMASAQSTDPPGEGTAAEATQPTAPADTGEAANQPVGTTAAQQGIRSFLSDQTVRQGLAPQHIIARSAS